MPRTVTIEGVYVDDSKQMYVFADLNPNCTTEDYTPAYPHVVTESVTVSNFRTNGEPALQLSPNRILFRDTEFTVK